MGMVMGRWPYLGAAIISEIIATSSLKSTENFTNLLPSIVVVVGYSAAFYFLAVSLDEIPVGVAYSIWSGVGIVGIAVVSMIVYGQRPDLGAVIGMGLIIAGIVVMRIYSDMAME